MRIGADVKTFFSATNAASVSGVQTNLTLLLVRVVSGLTTRE